MGLNQPSQHDPGIEMGSPEKNLWRTLLCNGMNPLDIYGRSTQFFENGISAETLPVWTEGARDRTK